MKNKFKGQIITILTLAFFLTLMHMPMALSASAAEITLKLAEVSPPGGMRPETSRWMAKEIEKRTNGKVKVEIYWGGSLVGLKEALRSIQAGVADMCAVAQSYFSKELPLSLFSWNSNYHPTDLVRLGRAYWKLYEEIPAFQKELKKYNQRMFTVWPYEAYNIQSTKPIRLLKDLKGMKIRGVGKHTAILKAAGAVPVSVPSVEMYEAIEKGILDGATCNTECFDRYHTYESAKYATYGLNLPMYSVLFTINLETWNKLSPDIQKIMIDIGKENSDRFGKSSMEKRDDICNKWKSKYGVEIINLPASDRDALFSLPEIVSIKENWIKDMEKKGLPGKLVIDRYFKYTGGK